MATIYQNGTVVSIPGLPFNPSVDRSVNPVDKCFGVSFKTKQKIFDAAHIQAMELSNSGFQYTGNKHKHNQIFLTPTFDMNNPSSFIEGRANEAIKKFTDNLTNTYEATSYLWVKEFTANLTPHYHMLVTIPRVPIKDLNRAWSKARGDSVTVGNALRTGWDNRHKKPVMKVRNYKHAVGYAAKYITKSRGGDISVFKTSCRISGKQVWEYKTGHSTKCYGMSQNLHRKPREIDFFLQMHLHPWMAKEVIEQPTDYCTLFFFDNPQYANILYANGTEKKAKTPRLPYIPPEKPPILPVQLKIFQK